MIKPRYRLLDLFCGGGGASAGYFRAGFDVIGVDVNQQPEYPFRLLRRDAILSDYEFLDKFDVVHASPPCQGYSRGSIAARAAGRVYDDFYPAVKAMLVASGKPYVIENVVGSPLKGVRLMGHMFGLGVVRERIFESNVPISVPFQRSYSGSIESGEYVTVAGNRKDSVRWKDAMGINWIRDLDQLKEAIPPDYTEFIGRQLIYYLELKNQAKDDKPAKDEKRLQHERVF